MRTVLLGSLLDVAARNLARGAERLAIFEAGAVYLDTPAPAARMTAEGVAAPFERLAGAFRGERPAPVTEPFRVGALAVGALAPASWRGAAEPADFFALKGVLEALARGLRAELAFAPVQEPFLHPGRSAAVLAGGEPAGWLGEVHPLVCRAWDVEAAVAFEIDAAPLLAASAAGEEDFEDITEFPPVRQDIAVVVPESVPAAELVELVRGAGGESLRLAEVFDVYRGEQLGEERKSLALRLEFAAPDRTLTDEEVAGLRDQIVAAVEGIGGTLRG
jgi:phenylalanyl-tRNA synthetase beta chain